MGSWVHGFMGSWSVERGAWSVEGGAWRAGLHATTAWIGVLGITREKRPSQEQQGQIVDSTNYHGTDLDEVKP
jgi:hypothetical protein